MTEVNVLLDDGAEIVVAVNESDAHEAEVAAYWACLEQLLKPVSAEVLA